MKMVTYKVLSKAMRELTGQVAELDEAIEIRLVFGEKVKITISMDWATMDAARAALFPRSGISRASSCSLAAWPRKRAFGRMWPIASTQFGTDAWNKSAASGSTR